MSYLNKMSGIQNNVLNIKNYSVITSKVLGQGAFGIVFKGTHGKEKAVAAKRIDVSIHPKILKQDYERLKELDHKNVMKVLDVEQVVDILWVFMPFCEFGDLNEYYRTRDVALERGCQIMAQIMKGVCYLHENNVIHRDIKPGNILVEVESPLLVKLTDFDVTKFLDPEIETSVMSSNVGTNAFKAPEFHLRNEKKKIQYHRNVDVYAAGLTFLAMIQYNKPASKLIPRIETPNSPSELHVPIGQLVAERIRYKVTQRNILIKDEKILENDQETVDERAGIRWRMRELVRQMTNEIPEDRLSAAECLKSIQKICPIEMKETQTFRTNLKYTGSVIVTSKKQIIASTEAAGKDVIRVMDHSGRFIKDVTSLCSGISHHAHGRRLLKHPTDPNCILEACWWCEAIRMYNIDTTKVKEIYSDCAPFAMCGGPDDSVLVWDVRGKVLQLKWSSDEENLKLIKQHDAGIPRRIFRSMCFDNETNCIVLSKGNSTVGMKVRDGSVKLLWKRNNWARAVTCDSHGRIFLCENDSLLIINAADGDLLQRIKRTNRDIADICWTPFQPQLTLLDMLDDIVQFEIELPNT